MTLRRALKIAVVLCLLADLGLLGWLLSPRAPSRAATQQQLVEARAQLATLRARIAQMSRLESRLKISRRQIQGLLDSGVPVQKESSSVFLQTFGKLAQDSKVEVSGATFHPDQNAKAGLRRVAIELQVSGGYRGVVRFLNELERSPMLFIINQVSVSGGEGVNGGAATAGPDQLKLQVQLEAYVRA